MSQIKSYLSIESVPSYQFITPAKNIIQNMPTNNSMAFSQSLGTNDSKSNSYRNFLRSNEVFRDFNYQLRDQVQQQSEEIINNNSSITLHPTISKSDINELFCTTKMILFLAGECEQKRQVINNKKKGLMTLQKGISILEERIEQNQSIFKSKEKSIKSRSLSIQKQSIKKSKRLTNEIVDMKLDIKKMERSLSSKKQTIRSSAKKDGKYLFQTERRRKPIYVPVLNTDRPVNPYTNYHFTSPHPFFGQYSMHQQHPFAQSMQPEYFRHEQDRNNSQILTNSLNYSDQNHLKNSLKKASLNEDKISSNPSTSLNSNPILNMLKSKLNGLQGSAMFQAPVPSIRAEIQRNYNNRNPEAFSNRKPASIQSNSSYSRQNSNIKINILPEAPPNLDYLNDDCDDFSDQILMNSNNVKKMERSIKELKMSAKSNKWKNDEDVEEDRQLLKSLTSIKTIEHNTKDHPRSSMGAKIIQTHLGAEQENISFDLPEKSRGEPSHQRSHNKSKIEVLLFQNSSDKKNDSNSNDYTPKSPNKSLQRQSILNSQVGIILHDVSDYEESPNKTQPRSNPSKTNILLKEFPKIQEIEDDGYSRANTPNDFSVFNKGFQPIRDSKLSNSKQEVILRTSCPTDKAQSQKSPLLSRPPSLVEEEDDDMIDSIQLATNSRHSISSLKKGSSLINKASAISKNEEEEDGDFLGGFKLVTMSRVSRERVANSSPEKFEGQMEDFPDTLQNDSLLVSKLQKKMTRSNLDEVKATEEKDELDDAIGSNIRNSSTSVIVKKNKNSAIQRSVGHIEKPGKNSNLKSSLRGSYLSGQLSTPIAQAEEEEQQYSHIIKKHKRSETDLCH